MGCSVNIAVVVNFNFSDIFSLTPEDDRAAEVDVRTKKASHYDFPTNSNIQLWDLPGFGTQTAGNLETFCEKFSIPKYDAFIIMSCTPFTNDYMNLAKKLQSHGKPFFFVQSQVDLYLANCEYDTPDNFNENEVLDQIRTEYNELQKANTLDSQIGDLFLINCHERGHFDFGELEVAIANNLTLKQHRCFIRAVSSKSIEILEEKVNALKGI